MPVLSPYTVERRGRIVSEVATHFHHNRLLWSRPMCPWYGRLSTEVPWQSGRAGTQLRDRLVSRYLQELAGQEPYRHWPEMRSYGMLRSPIMYDLYTRVRWIWEDWAEPEDLPS